jgi:hypothetical protein
MELIEMLREIAIREGFAAGRSLREVCDETGLSLSEVIQREVDLHLIPADEAAAKLSQGPH